MEKPSRRFWQRILLTWFSVGWLLPMWWVGDGIVAMTAFEAAPHLFAHGPDLFFFIHAGREVFGFSMLWLAAVLYYWIATLTRR